MNNFTFTLGRSRIDINRNLDTSRLENWHRAIVQRQPVLTLDEVDRAIETLRLVREELQTK